MTAAIDRAAWGVVHAARKVALASAPGYPPPEAALDTLRAAVADLALVDPTDPNHPAPPMPKENP